MNIIKKKFRLFAFEKTPCIFRAEKCNIIACVSFDCAPGSKFKKITGFFRLKKFPSFLNIPGKQQHFNLTSGKRVYCFHEESIFFVKN